MTAHLLIWLAWFFAASWMENAVILCKRWFAKGVHAMRKLGLDAFEGLRGTSIRSGFQNLQKLVRSLAPLLLIAGLFTGLPRLASAQDQTADPPGRVARLSYTEGSVSYQVSGDSDWVQADPNRPLTTNDNLWVDKDSRGEVHIGSTAIRLASETGISFLNLDDRTAQIQLAQGTIEVHLRHLVTGDAWEIDTPNLAFTLNRSGEYRISTDPNSNSTVIVVREGEGSVSGGGESYDLEAGQQYTFTGTDQLSQDAQPQPGFDDFESWCQSRDQLENNSPSAHYVSRDVDGYYDLDSNGTWTDVPDYGQVWIPQNVEVGWAPYHVGHWVWIAPWGWTWVDAEPWGWAPFHYGRWVVVGEHWGWVPGPIVVRPVYAPALVGFVGGGGFGFSVGFGGGLAGVAWFPLGPRDVFVPGYRCSERYVQTVNVTNTRVVNVTQVTNVYNTVVINRTSVSNIHYTYETNERAVTAVSRETFVNARPVQSGSIRVNAEQIRSARVVENAPLAPTRASYVSSTARVSTARPSVPISQRPVVAKLPPATPVRNARATVYTNDSREFNQPQNRGNEEQNRAVQQANRTNETNRPNESNPNGGFRPFTPPSNNNAASQNQRMNQNQYENRNQENRPNENINRDNNRPPTENQARPSVRFAPPAKAKDENYDVHPPLNQRPQAQPEPRSEPRPQPKQESKPQPKQEKEKPHSRE